MVHPGGPWRQVATALQIVVVVLVLDKQQDQVAVAAVVRMVGPVGPAPRPILAAVVLVELVAAQ